MDSGELAFIHRNVLISTVGASARIENAVLTDAEVDRIDTKLTEESQTTIVYKGVLLSKTQTFPARLLSMPLAYSQNADLFKDSSVGPEYVINSYSGAESSF